LDFPAWYACAQSILPFNQIIFMICPLLSGICNAAQNIRQFAIARTVSNFGFNFKVFTFKVTGIILSKLS